METQEDLSIAAELSAVSALLAGTDQPVALDPAEDLSIPATPPQARRTEIVEAAPEGASDVIDILATADEPPAPAISKPKKAEKLDKPKSDEPVSRNAAFADRVAQQRAKDMLGDLYAPVTTGMANAPKKVAEKVYNALCHIAGRGKLSGYTAIALNLLREKGDVTSADLIAAFKEAGFTDATARSQGNQQMAALPILTLATRDGSKLTFNDGRMVELIDGAGEAKEPRSPSKSAEEPAPVVLADEDLLAGADGSNVEAVPGDVSDEELLGVVA